MRSRVRVLRFLAPNIVKLEWGEVENGILKVGNKVFSLLYVEEGKTKTIEPIILDRGFFGKEPLYIVFDVNILPIKFEMDQVETTVSYDDFVKFLQRQLAKYGVRFSEAQIKQLLGNFDKAELKGNILIPKTLNFEESKDWLPSFIGNLIDANVVASFSKELEKERKVSLPKIGYRTILFFILLIIVFLILIGGGYIKI